jgi:regulator of replication initiation timing
MKFTPEQQQHIASLIERRLVADRKTRTRAIESLVLERDALAVENDRLRIRLRQQQQRIGDTNEQP